MLLTDNLLLDMCVQASMGMCGTAAEARPASTNRKAAALVVRRCSHSAMMRWGGVGWGVVARGQVGWGGVGWGGMGWGEMGWSGMGWS